MEEIFVDLVVFNIENIQKSLVVAVFAFNLVHGLNVAFGLLYHIALLNGVKFYEFLDSVFLDSPHLDLNGVLFGFGRLSYFFGLFFLDLCFLSYFFLDLSFEHIRRIGLADRSQGVPRNQFEKLVIVYFSIL